MDTRTLRRMGPFQPSGGPAFEDVVDRYGPLVRRTCRDILGHDEDALDAAQATFLIFVRRGGAIRDGGSTGRWLYEVARRVAWRERRRQARRWSRERPMATREVAAPGEAGAEDREVRPIVHDEIGRLPAKLRDPIVLCYLEGLSVEGAAGRLHCPVGTLKSRLGRGREVLRSRLARRGLGGAAILFLLLRWEEPAGAATEVAADAALKARLVGPRGSAVPARVARMVRRDGSPRRLAVVGLVLALLVLLAFPGGSHARSSLIPSLLAVPPLGASPDPSANTGPATHCVKNPL